jgi:HAD superfamily hydrolase (TIGR01509 family)
MNIKGVVFDMDGLMFDTERLTYEIINDTMTSMGYSYSLDFYKQTVGKRSVDVVQMYKEKFGKDFDYQAMKVKNMEVFWDYTTKNGVPVKKGLFELLDYLKEKGIKIALATSTTRKSATEILTRGKAIDYFDVLMCADSVTNGKPHPQVFLKACQGLGLEPQECMGLEDSFNGIIASSKAGLLTVMVPDMILPTKEIENLCYKVCTNLLDVIEILKS